MKRAILRCLAAALKWFVCRFSPAATCRVGIVIGDIWRMLDRRRRTITRHNLRMVFGETKSEEELNRIEKEVFRNIAQTAVEFVQIPMLTSEKAYDIITIEGREKLDDSLRSGGGVVLIASHFGNWELMGAVSAIIGYKISAVARPVDDPDVDEIVREIRESSGMQIIPRRVSALGIVRKLKRNEIVGILGDQNTRMQNIFVDFFGIKASTTPGPAMLALRTGAALVPVFMIREGSGKHRFIVEDPIEVDRTADLDADVFATTQKCADILEEYIRKYPSQWFWVHRRWKTRPPGEPPIY